VCLRERTEIAILERIIIFTTLNNYNYIKMKANNIIKNYKLISSVAVAKCVWAIRMSSL